MMHSKANKDHPGQILGLSNSLFLANEPGIWWTVGLVFLLLMGCKPKEPVPSAGTFTQTSPAALARQVDLLPAFRWEESPHAVSYTLVVSRKADFSSPVITTKGITGNSYAAEVSLANGVLYYWKVSAENETGSVIAQNAGIAFRTITTAPLPSPAVSKYYVAPTGEDNPDQGTAANPFKTLAYAATRVPSDEGDTIYLNAGTYIETDPARIPLGVSVIGAGAGQTILSSGEVTLPEGLSKDNSQYKLWYDGSLIQLVSPHRIEFRNVKSSVIRPANGNQTLSGFTIDGNNKSLKAGVWVENRNNVTMHHVTIKNCQQRGAVFGAGNKDFYVEPAYYMTGISIHDCVFSNSGKDLPDETLGNLCLAQLDGAEIYNLAIDDTEGYGIKFIYDGYFKNTHIHDCTISLNEQDTKWGEDIAIELWNLGPGNKIDHIQCNTWLSIVNHQDMFGKPVGTENMKISAIRMIDKDGKSGKEAIEVGAPGVEIAQSYFENKGFGIAIWDMGRENITVRSNVFYNSSVKDNWASGAAIYIDNSRTWAFKNLRIFNNVFDTHKVAVRIKGSKVSEVYIRNNVFLNASLWDIQAEGSAIVATNNLKYATDPVWYITGVTTDQANIVGNPTFKNAGNRWENFYKPASASSLVVDQGTDVGIPYLGSAPDIGWLEY